MTTRLKTARLPLPSPAPSEGVFQLVVECCVYMGSNRFVPEQTLERKARLRPATPHKAREPLRPPRTRQRVA